MKKRISIFLSTVLALSLVGCGTQASSTPNPTTNANAPKDPIKIGIIAPLTGTEAEFGIRQKYGYTLALEEINNAGGINGRKVELEIVDDKSNVQEAAKDVDQLANQAKVQVIVGSYSSGNGLAIVKKATSYNIPVVLPTATAKNVTETGSKYAFRVCATSEGYAQVVADFLKTRPDAKTLAIIYEDQNFGTSAAKAMEDVLKGSDIQIVAKEQYSAKAVDYKPLLNRVKAKNPDAIYFASYLLDATTLMKQAHEVDLNVKYYTAAGTGFSTPDFVKSAGKDAEYTLAAGQWSPSVAWKGAKEFADTIQQKFNVTPGYYEIEGYASLMVAKAAIEKAGVYDKEKIRDALAGLQLDTSFGPIKFDAKGDNAHPTILTQIQDGKFTTVFPKDVATTEAKVPTPPWNQR